MKYYIIIVLFLITSLLVLPQRIISVELDIRDADYTIQAYHFANQFGVDGDIVSKVIKCESEGKQYAVGDGGLSKGVAQFQKSTWDRMEKKYLEEYVNDDLDYNSSFDQIKLLSYAISKGWGNEWTAYRAIKNGGTYSFYSKQLNKSFIVKCK